MHSGTAVPEQATPGGTHPHVPLVASRQHFAPGLGLHDAAASLPPIRYVAVHEQYVIPLSTLLPQESDAQLQPPPRPSRKPGSAQQMAGLPTVAGEHAISSPALVHWTVPRVSQSQRTRSDLPETTDEDSEPQAMTTAAPTRTQLHERNRACVRPITHAYSFPDSDGSRSRQPMNQRSAFAVARPRRSTRFPRSCADRSVPRGPRPAVEPRTSRKHLSLLG